MMGRADSIEINEANLDQTFHMIYRMEGKYKVPYLYKMCSVIAKTMNSKSIFAETTSPKL